MESELLDTHEAARRLGISRATAYKWLSASDNGSLVIRGQQVTINYLQGGGKGQGRIKIEAREVERVKEAMQARPRVLRQRRPPAPRQHFPGIHVTLGDLDD